MYLKSVVSSAVLLASVLAADPFLNEVDTGLQDFLYRTANWTAGTKPNLRDIRALPDFEFVAREVLADNEYSFYRLAAGQEWSYRNNLEVWRKVPFRPRVITDVTNLNQSIGVEIFGYNFTAPFFIAPAANAAYGDPERAELNFMEASGDANILYIAALLANKTIEELDSAKREETLNGRQVIFQQIYTNRNLSVTWDAISRAEKTGAKAIVWTVDNPGNSVRVREARYSPLDILNAATRPNTWDTYAQIREHTKLPIIVKGIQSVEDALESIKRGVDGIYLSNHGGRQLEFAPSALEIAYEIYRNAPEVFENTVVLADGGVRSGADVLKLLALGVKAVGLGRPFMFANCYGYPGVSKAIKLLRNEVVQDGWNLGINSIKDLNPKLLNLRQLESEVHLMNRWELE